MAMTSETETVLSDRGIGGTIRKYHWTFEKREVTICYETLGTGTPVLLLPAFSTVSSREEMVGIARSLSPYFQVVALDWLGFGDSERPEIEYTRALYQQLIQHFVRDCFDKPVAIVAAGHASGYALHCAHTLPNACAKLVLIAPTWKGPFRAMGMPKLVAGGVRTLVRSPLLGQALYALNTAPAFLEFMYRRHVYVDCSLLTSDFIKHKHRITQQSGARFAPAAFVTGALDPMRDREEWLSVARSLELPVLAIFAEHSPPQSKAEMDALTALPQIQHQNLPGSLGLHEELATDVGATVLKFLQHSS
ncbi:putative hydrolase or acyltransferase (alpha/beta hydrolase superfamily) [Rubidibacter lacunae KORDI 51-2]|uniref:Putative hydrolase or acyltransferase (Alpha/beta hydrolase superfamily) n=1 Tax=Rubidibacter lacunae KORDI 51-2 TaxID=582515 RepID=U5DQ34_9CHRO|nr:alpha/beta hydrolase [Rubidibacter lacunae]ERN42967.1 putative hydrolase or acyltransferase (alpha/beta hydrolase superfamily) [Rubidibacter lacunae KORDI 51-2]